MPSTTSPARTRPWDGRRGRPRLAPPHGYRWVPVLSLVSQGSLARSAPVRSRLRGVSRGDAERLGALPRPPLRRRGRRAVPARERGVGSCRPLTLSAGSRLGPYEILSPIGAGGMGEVYKAKDTRLDRTVAIKVLPQKSVPSAEARQRFEREARTISQLSHPHICALYDVGRDGETEYLVMELLEGETLADRLASRPAAARADAASRRRHRGRARPRAPAGHRPSGPEARQRDADAGGRQAPRLRSRAGFFGGVQLVRRVHRPAHVAAEPDAGGLDPRHRAVHVAGAARGQGERRAHGHLRVRRAALRDGDGPEGVHGRVAGLADLVDHERGARGDHLALADEPAGSRPRRPDLPRQGPRRSVADGSRRGAAAPGDPG